MGKIYQAGQQIDHYEIVRLLGMGGASRVYLARDLSTERQVVLKFPLDDLVGGAAIYERYRREVEIGKRLVHPRIQMYLNQEEAWQEDYLVLEYVQGRTLRAVMKETASSCLSVEETLRMILLLCDAVAYAHEHGVIHRDIKPENILLLADGDIKLLDFGIALIVDEKRTLWSRMVTSPLVGTPAYMAPERLEGKPGSVQSDVYAVGVVLYELLCGRPPFEEEEAFVTINPHISDDPPDILRFHPDLLLELATVVMRTIRRDLDKRYASIEAVAQDIQHLDKVIAVPYVPAAPKLWGKYRQVVGIALIVLVVLVMLMACGVFAQLVHSGR